MATRPNAEQLRETAKQYVWPLFGKDPSFFDTPGSIVASAEGPYITDVHGNRYVDALACAAAATLGYNHPHVVEAMVRQMGAIVQNPSGWPPSVPQIQLAEKIASLTPGSLKYTIFSCNGTDANETAIKIARQYWKLRGKGTKHKVIGRTRNYHGISISTLAAGGIVPRRRMVEPLPTGYAHINTPNPYRCDYPDAHPDCGARYAEELRRAIEFEDPSTVACFVGEQTTLATTLAGGVLPPPPDYMRRIREICDEYEVLLIADEVVTGFGRTGAWFECLHYDYVPDIVTMAKGITSGHAPLSAAHVKEEIAQAFFGEPDRLFQHGYTFGGMAVSCAAALATIEYLEETGLVSQVPAKAARFRGGLERIKEASPVVGDVRGTGLLLGVELVRDKETKETWPDAKRAHLAKTLVEAGKRAGVLLQALTLHDNLYILLAPPFNISDADMEVILEGLRAAVQAVERESE